jgi:exonuclease V gamma subunit
MNQGQERPLLVETWLGSTVLVEYIGGQRLEDDVLRRISTEDLTVDAPQRVKTSLFVLENYNPFGIEVRSRGDSEPQFLPWNAVLRMVETDRETSQDFEEARQEEEQVEQTEEASPPHVRQELMNRLANAQTPSEIADVKADVDRWLAAHPGDGDVRLAREQLGTEDPEEYLDLEAGSPT